MIFRFGDLSSTKLSSKVSRSARRASAVRFWRWAPGRNWARNLAHWAAWRGLARRRFVVI